MTFLAIGAFDEANVGAFIPGKKLIFIVELGILLVESSITGLPNLPPEPLIPD